MGRRRDRTERDPKTGSTLITHVYLLPQKEIDIIENPNLEELSRDRHYVFAFTGVPMKLNGATGSPLERWPSRDGSGRSSVHNKRRCFSRTAATSRSAVTASSGWTMHFSRLP